MDFLGDSYESLAIAALVGGPVIFGLVAYFSNARAHRIAGALAGGTVGALVNIAVDVMADRLELWWYPTLARPFAPLAYYVATAFVVAAIGLIAWRLSRRFGVAGTLITVAAVAIYAPIRDGAWAASTDVIAFGPGLLPHLAEVPAVAAIVAVAVLVMRMVSGPPGADPVRSLAGRSASPNVLRS